MVVSTVDSEALRGADVRQSVLSKVNGQAVKTSREIMEALSECRPGSPLKLSFIIDNREVTLNVPTLRAAIPSTGMDLSSVQNANGIGLKCIVRHARGVSGLKAGDEIIGVHRVRGGKPFGGTTDVSNVEDVTRLLRAGNRASEQLKVGDEIGMIIKRGGKTFTVNVPLQNPYEVQERRNKGKPISERGLSL